MIFATDGSGGNSQVAGYGVVVYNPVTKSVEKTCKGSVCNMIIRDASIQENMKLDYEYTLTDSTNNRGELCGILCAILLAKSMGLNEITIIADSTYCINTFREGGWLEDWKRKGIVNKKANPDLVTLIDAKRSGLHIRYIHQRSHLKKHQIANLRTDEEKLYYKLNAIADKLAEMGKNN
jgi:ribonuclease HI